jgi:hypothetical protein
MALLDVAKDFLKKKSWSYDVAKSGAILRLGFVGKNGRWPCYIEVKDDVGELVFFSVREGPVPAEQRAAVAEYLMRVNCRLNVGNLELNFDDGLVRCRSGIDVEGHKLDEQLMSNLALLNVATMDKFLPGLEAVLKGTAPKKALDSLKD